MAAISVANGWQHILAEAIAEAAALPEQWCFEIVKAETVGGALNLSATYVSGDVPLDDHLPPERKLPHPWRSEMRIREAARTKSLATCECCGHEGRLVGAGEGARVRCVQHVYVVDAMEWSGNPVGFLFDSADEAMAHFLADYRKGLDTMPELQAAQVQEDDDDTRH
ncbi:hypothetical protein GFL38_10355 [Rhizobium leguminosarum bv. viciae]|uniref:hypothetical protein n=1 Tax=Rhizobium ruizarguesonis TaxID=2081791 RepID=UPI00143FB344|nr:hypothetical protein [Rhizobium ruizarguesonis]NKJ72665.1 hypothetical protein [Rhizobium leguminosarum bv. viciae]NKQ80342.1 hypothetical protein [Rhizobium ruizarguesonis]